MPPSQYAFTAQGADSLADPTTGLTPAFTLAQGDDLVPVAWQGQIGEYLEETEDQLRLKMGQGITGWVAQHGTPVYLPDAAHDPRVRVIPGTEADLPESLLVVPAVYEERVIGVIVLSMWAVITAYKDLDGAAFFAAFVVTVLLNRVAFWVR